MSVVRQARRLAPIAPDSSVRGGVPWRSWFRAAALLALLGATLGTALDAVHVHTGTTSYPTGSGPMLAGQPWWVPPLFALAAVLYGFAGPVLDAVSRSQDRPPERRTAILGIGLFVLAYLLSGLLAGTLGLATIGVAGVLAVVAVLLWWVADRRWQGWVLAAGAAASGTMFEAALVALGAFKHADSDFLGVPFWLPVLYCSAGIALGSLGRRLLASQSRSAGPRPGGASKPARRPADSDP
jgi:hypothetical protein